MVFTMAADVIPFAMAPAIYGYFKECLFLNSLSPRFSGVTAGIKALICEKES